MFVGGGGNARFTLTSSVTVRRQQWWGIYVIVLACLRMKAACWCDLLFIYLLFIPGPVLFLLTPLSWRESSSACTAHWQCIGHSAERAVWIRNAPDWCFTHTWALFLHSTYCFFKIFSDCIMTLHVESCILKYLWSSSPFGRRRIFTWFWCFHLSEFVVCVLFLLWGLLLGFFLGGGGCSVSIRLD